MAIMLLQKLCAPMIPTCITWSKKYSAIYRLLEQVLCYQARAEKVPANTVSTDNNYEYNNFSPALPH